MTKFLYTPRSGQKLLNKEQLEFVGFPVVEWQNESLHAVGCMELAAYAASPGAEYARDEARKVACEIARRVNGLAFDDCGFVGVLIPKPADDAARRQSRKLQLAISLVSGNVPYNLSHALGQDKGATQDMMEVAIRMQDWELLVTLALNQDRYRYISSDWRYKASQSRYVEKYEIEFFSFTKREEYFGLKEHGDKKEEDAITTATIHAPCSWSYERIWGAESFTHFAMMEVEN